MGEINGATKQSKIQGLIDLVIPLFQQHFTPSRAISIDEAMIAFRGRVSFRQYIRGKSTPWGIKAYVLADSATGYMYSVLPYYGKETQLLDRPGLNHTTKVVLTLMAPLGDRGYDLYTDRFYTSPQLAVELGTIDTTLTGTAMSNRKNMPLAVKHKRKRSKGDVKTYKKGMLVVTEWTDKRTLITLSSKHSNRMMDVTTRYDKHTHTPTHVHTHTHTYTHAHTHMHTHTHTHPHTCMHTHTHTHMHACTCTHTHTHTHTHMHAHSHTHAYIHTYTHTPALLQRACKI